MKLTSDAKFGKLHKLSHIRYVKSIWIKLFSIQRILDNHSKFIPKYEVWVLKHLSGAAQE